MLKQRIIEVDGGYYLANEAGYLWRYRVNAEPHLFTGRTMAEIIMHVCNWTDDERYASQARLAEQYIRSVQNHMANGYIQGALAAMRCARDATSTLIGYAAL